MAARPVGMKRAAKEPGRGDRTRERILAASEALVLRQGFAGTSLDDILKATKLTKGAFFHHFAGKADLGAALVERYRQNHLALFERFAAEADAATDDPIDGIVLFLSLFEAFIAARTKPLAGCVFAAFTHEDAPFDASLRALIAESIHRWTELYEARFGAVLACYRPKIDVSAAELAEMVVTIIEGGLVLSRSFGDAHLVARQSRQFRNYLELLFGDREASGSGE